MESTDGECGGVSLLRTSLYKWNIRIYHIPFIQGRTSLEKEGIQKG